MKLIELMNEIQKCKSMEEMMAIADRDDVVSSAESLVQEIKDLLVKFGEKHTELKGQLEKAINAEGWTMEQVLEYADAVRAGEIEPNAGSSSWKKETLEKVDAAMDQLNVVMAAIPLLSTLMMRINEKREKPQTLEEIRAELKLPGYEE